MLKPRWRKVLLDLWSNKIRSLLVILSIAVGVFAVGYVSAAFVLILHDMDADYQAANPHGAIIFCEPFGDDLLEVLRDVPGVGEIEGRSGLTARIVRGAEDKIPINISTTPPVAEKKLDLLRPHIAGTELVLDDHEIFLERSALSGLPLAAGDTLTIELNDGKLRELRVAAWVHDINVFPYTFFGQVTAYVSPETIVWLGGTRDYNQVYLTVAAHKSDETHVKAVTQAVADKIEKGSRAVYSTFVFRPGRHWASDITEALGIMMGVMGTLSVFLSAFLVTNTISALLTQQIRQIGIMKAIGAAKLTLISMYIVLVLSFGVLALLIAVPLSSLAAYATAQGIGEYLNFTPGQFRIPLSSLLLQVGVSLAVPVGAALFPVMNGTRITVREALNTYGLGGGHFGRGLLDRALEKIRFMSRPLLISLRNTFRRKLRLALTLSTLTLAGAMFIAVFNLRAAMNIAITETMGYILADVTVSFDRPHRFQKLAPLVLSVPGVVSAEGWGLHNAQVLSADKTTEVEVSIFAPPADSELIEPTMTAGRWLLPADENALIIGNHLLDERPDLRVGDEVVLEIEGKEYDWKIAGIYKMAGNFSPPLVYANYEYLAELVNEPDQVSNLRIITASQDRVTQERVARILEAKFRRAGITVTNMTTGAQETAQQISQINVMVVFMLIMAVLIAVVGGLGLMGMMSMNVLERTREIGVMRAIGAADGAVLQLVIVEGMLVGAVSWLLGALLALPISLLLDQAIGAAIMTVPLDFVFSYDGFVIWLLGVLILAALASVLPARSAARLTIREVLAYE